MSPIGDKIPDPTRLPMPETPDARYLDELRRQHAEVCREVDALKADAFQVSLDDLKAGRISVEEFKSTAMELIRQRSARTVANYVSGLVESGVPVDASIEDDDRVKFLAEATVADGLHLAWKAIAGRLAGAILDARKRAEVVEAQGGFPIVLPPGALEH